LPLMRNTLAVPEVSRLGEVYRFSAPIERSGSGAYVTVPFDAEAAFGKKRVPIRATIDGVPYVGSLVRMGGGSHVLGVLKEIRVALDKDQGDVVDVVLEEDTAPRVVDMPGDLAAALESAPEAARFFDELAYSHQREYVRWILDAKRDETRAARVARTLELLAAGEKSH